MQMCKYKIGLLEKIKKTIKYLIYIKYLNHT